MELYEQILQVLSKLEKASAKEIIDQLSEPKPTYKRVVEIIGILEKKSLVWQRTQNRGFIYYPMV